MGASDFLSAGGDVASGLLNYFGQQEAQNKNIAMDYDFAKNGIQWKVADAKAAGLNPLYALGAPTMSPSVSIQNSNAPLADMSRNLGQDLSRAMTSTMTADDRKKKDAMDALNLEHAKLNNDLLKVNISNASKNQPRNPPLPGSGVITTDATPSKKGWELDLGPLGKYSEKAGEESLDKFRRALTDTYHGVHLYEWAKRMLGY